MRNVLTRVCFRGAVALRQLGHQFNKKDPTWQQILDDWENRKGDQELRLDYDLNEQSVVFDMGGFDGNWSAEIYARYRSKIEIFEPYVPFAEAISKRFRNNPDLKIHTLGLGRKSEQKMLAVDSASTSIFKTEESDNVVEIELQEANSFLEKNNYTHIDLMKINIEGGEYELLEHLIENGWIEKIKNFQIQFHHFVPNAKSRMKAIQDELSKTHEATWQFEFLWENWQRKK